MMLYASVRGGHLQLGPLGAGPEIIVAYDEFDRLVEYFLGKALAGIRLLPEGGSSELPDGWDGHIMCSSSIDFAHENGWPRQSAHEFIERAVKVAVSQLEYTASRFAPFIRFAMARRGKVWPTTVWTYAVRNGVRSVERKR